MGIFDIFKKKQSQGESANPRASQAEVMAKCMAAVRAYQSQEFSKAAQLFSEYFQLKGYGRFPTLDADDYRMYMNLLLSQFYSRQYRQCLQTCQIVSKLEPNRGDSYAFKALCYYKLGNESEANLNWKKAKSLGCEMTLYFDNVGDVKMQGFND